MIWKFSRQPAHEMAVLIVCLGNICRSPTAEAVLRHKLAEAGLDKRVRVDSAGISSVRGSAPDARATAAALQRGYATAKLRARDLVAEDFEAFDLLLAMDLDNMASLRARCPADQLGRLELFSASLSGGPREVPDPYYGPVEGFDVVLDLIEPACDAWVERLRIRLDAAKLVES